MSDLPRTSTTFLNVRITIDEEPGIAYTMLCNVLDLIQGDFETDTYVAEVDGQEFPEASTEELFPESAGV